MACKSTCVTFIIMIENLAILRQAGFFKDFKSLTDAALIDVLEKRREERYSTAFGYEYQPGHFSHLLQLLAEDNTKIIDIDLEADVLNGNDVYVSILETFAKASNGYFNPTNIKEIWNADEGPIKVTFLSNGHQITFEPEYMDDWIDGRIFNVINQEMKRVSNEVFFACSGPNDEWLGQNIIHIRLTDDEKQLLREKLGWNFSDL